MDRQDAEFLIGLVIACIVLGFVAFHLESQNRVRKTQQECLQIEAGCVPYRNDRQRLGLY